MSTELLPIHLQFANKCNCKNEVTKSIYKIQSAVDPANCCRNFRFLTKFVEMTRRRKITHANIQIRLEYQMMEIVG